MEASTPSVRRSTKAGASTPATRLLRRYLSLTLAQRGASTPATLLLAAAFTLSSTRSTKAGASTPATRRSGLWMASVPGCFAQRRPGHQPRRHVDTGGRLTRDIAARRPLNEGRGINPGDTVHRLPRLSMPPTSLNEGRMFHARTQERGRQGVIRSTKAGASTPATLSPSTQRTLSRRPLNPGDTCGKWADVKPSQDAQRRPGHQPRRHGVHRSSSALTASCDGFAQRRPGHQPRRHPTQKPTRSRTQPRRALHRGESSHEEIRSTKAGASTPATRSSVNAGPCCLRTCGGALNEGRGINPGDTIKRHIRAIIVARTTRSTKAGASTPATPPTEARPTAGVLRRAQRRPGHQPRRH